MTKNIENHELAILSDVLIRYSRVVDLKLPNRQLGSLRFDDGKRQRQCHKSMISLVE